MYMFMVGGGGVHAGDSCDVMAVPVHWLATGDTVAGRKGK